MSILYINPGYYQLLPEYTYEKANSTSHNYTGTSIQLGNQIYSHSHPVKVIDNLDNKNIYFNFDLDFGRCANTTTSNKLYFVKFYTNDIHYPYIILTMRINDFYLFIASSDGTLTEILKMTNIANKYEQTTLTFEIKINLSQDNHNFEKYEIIINNTDKFIKNDINYFNNDTVITQIDIANGHNVSGISTVYFSNMIIADEELHSANIVIVPTNIITTNWTKSGSDYITKTDNAILTQTVNYDKLNATVPIYENSAIKTVAIVGLPAYSKGTNDNITFKVDNLLVDIQELGNKSYMALESKLMNVSPKTGNSWTLQEFKDINFNIITGKQYDIIPLYDGNITGALMEIYSRKYGKTATDIIQNLTEIPYIFDAQDATNINSCFAYLTKLQISPKIINTENLTNIAQLFVGGNDSLTEYTPFDTSHATNMSCMFSDCINLETVTELNTQSATQTWQLFKNCSNLKNIPQLDLRNVEEAFNMFEGCTSLTQEPDILYPTQVNGDNISFIQMFKDCTGLTKIEKINTAYVSSLSGIFSGCSNLETLGTIDFLSCSSATDMFAGCDKLKTVTVKNIQNDFFEFLKTEYPNIVFVKE